MLGTARDKNTVSFPPDTSPGAWVVHNPVREPLQRYTFTVTEWHMGWLDSQPIAQPASPTAHKFKTFRLGYSPRQHQFRQLFCGINPERNFARPITAPQGDLDGLTMKRQRNGFDRQRHS